MKLGFHSIEERDDEKNTKNTRPPPWASMVLVFGLWLICLRNFADWQFTQRHIAKKKSLERGHFGRTEEFDFSRSRKDIDEAKDYARTVSKWELVQVKTITAAVSGMRKAERVKEELESSRGDD